MRTTILYQVQMQKLPPTEPCCPDVCMSTPCLPSTRPIRLLGLHSPLFFLFSFNLIKSISTKVFSSNFDLIKSNTFFLFHLQHSSFWTNCVLYFKTCVEYPDITQTTALFSVPACSCSTQLWALSGLEAQCQAPGSSMVEVYCKDTKGPSGCWIQGFIESEKRIMLQMWRGPPCPDWNGSFFPLSLYIFGY